MVLVSKPLAPGKDQTMSAHEQAAARKWDAFTGFLELAYAGEKLETNIGPENFVRFTAHEDGSVIATVHEGRAAWVDELGLVHPVDAGGSA